MAIKTALEAYRYAYTNGVAAFPKDWMITKNFAWWEAFVNEKSTDGRPDFHTFENAVESAQVMQKIRDKAGVSISIHCWVRQILHNIRAGSTATLSPHINGRAIDFTISGMSYPKAIQFCLDMQKAGLKIRVELGTKTWVHVDIGNSFNKDYRWGGFNP